tara:strand:+ start:13114 stop:13437 length:324 start_codon:yes stop_codon:yes gene_type:complete
MSEESKFDSNMVMGLAAIAVITTGWFALGYGHNTDTQTVATTEAPTEIPSVVASIIDDKVVEEVTVYADPSDLPSDEELATDELVEKAQEAADRNQANEDGKSENAE